MQPIDAARLAFRGTGALDWVLSRKWRGMCFEACRAAGFLIEFYWDPVSFSFRDGLLPFFCSLDRLGFEVRCAGLCDR